VRPKPLISCWVLAAGCGTDGYTPSCPPRPLYDVTVPAERTSAEVLRAEEEAIEAGCLTPRGEPALSNSGGSGEESVAGASGANP